MMRDRLKEQLELIGFQCARVVQYVMEGEHGINTKVDINTLIDSNVYKSTTFELSGEMEVITVLANDYIKYIESGRAVGATRVPISALARWASEKGLCITSNSDLYSIQSAIYRDGIPPRPIIEPSLELIEEYWNDWAKEVFDILMSDVEDWFRN